MSNKKLEIVNANKFYDSKKSKSVHAVKDLNLSINQGEIVALLGSSGCGKTSTLRMVAGFESVSSGDIILDGKKLNDVKISERNIAMAFEGYSLYPPLTVYQNMAFALKAAKISAKEVEQRVREMAELLEIADILDKYPSFISAGEQQRVSLGRALIRKASLYLLDEPMGQLEPLLRAFIRARVKHYIHTHGLTAVLVTHDQTEANALADRIAVMENGELQQFSTSKELLDKPVNLFVSTFFGEPPMNIFKATVKEQDENLTFHFENEKTIVNYPAKIFEQALIEKLLTLKTILFGIRPHQLKTSAEGFEATLETAHWLGDRTFVSFSFAGEILVLMTDDRVSQKPGETMTLSIPPESVHFFDIADGRAVNDGLSLRR